MSRIVVLFAVLLAALVSVWLWREDASPAPATADATSTDAGAPQSVVAAAGTTASAPREAVPGPAGASTTGATTLRVQLRGITPGVPWTTPVRLVLRGRDDITYDRLDHAAEQLPDANGSAVFELPSWVARWLREGNVAVNDPIYTPAHHRWQRGSDPPSEVVLDVVPTAALTGRVVDESGAPVAPVEVMVFRTDKGEPTSQSAGTTQTDADGRFNLHTTPNESLWLIAIGQAGSATQPLRERRQDLLPAATFAVAALGRITQVPDMVLRQPALISGRVRWSDGKPVAHARLDGAPEQPRGEAGAVFPMRLPNGQPAMPSSVVSDLDGEFALPAAAGVPTSVHVTMVNRRNSTPILGSAPRTVAAPARIELVLPYPVTLRGVHDGTHEFSANWHWNGKPLSHQPSNQFEVIVFERGRVYAERDAMRSEEVSIGPEHAGRTIDFELRTAATRVAFDFGNAGPVGFMLLHWRRSDGQSGSELLGEKSDSMSAYLPPGSYHLRIEGISYLLPTERDLVVGSEPITVAVQPDRGGCFTILAADRSGRYVAGSCTVLDGNGREIAVSFRAHRRLPMPKPLEPGRLGSAERNVCQTALPPGDYTLQLAFDGYPGRREALRIVAGETTEVRLQLP